MTRMLLIGALAMTAAAQAQVVVRAPGVYVEVGPAVVVRAFGVQVIVPRRGPAPPVMPPAVVAPPAPAPVPVEPGVPTVPAEEERLLPAPTPGAAPVVVRPVTPGEFVAGAKPFAAGRYEVVFLHPATRRPVKVDFELPVSPRSVSVTGSRIDFRWGLVRRLSLHFEPDGTVRVRG